MSSVVPVKDSPAPGAAVPVARTKIFRNSRILMCIYVVFSFCAYLACAGSVIVGIQEFIHIRANSFIHALNGIAWLGGAYGLYFCGKLLWTLGTRTWNDRVEFTPAGVHFYYHGPTKQREEWSTDWPKITKVAVRKSGQVMDYIIVVAPDDYFVFSSYSFTRPHTIAKEISAHSGIPFSEAIAADPK
jgi:hypothetical protein